MWLQKLKMWLQKRNWIKAKGCNKDGYVTVPDNQAIPENEIDQIFLRFGVIYGHRFTSLFPNQKAVKVAKAEWANALGELSGFQINQGLLRCRSVSDWNPNIPEFIRLATNLPDVFAAINRAIDDIAVSSFR